MRLDRLVLTLLLAGGVLCPTPLRAGGSWTFMLYLVADDDDSAEIEEAAIHDLDAIAERGPPAGVTVLVQVDRGKKLTELMRSRYQDHDYGGVMRYRIEKGTWRVLGKPGELNSGDPATLLGFLEWGVAQAPADHYALVISSHGSGTMSFRGPGAIGSARPGEVRLESYVAIDDKDDDCLTIMELGAVLDRFRQSQGRALDILGLDACFGAAVEALHRFQGGCEILIAAASTIPMKGFVYSPVMTELWRDPRPGPEALAEGFVKAFIDNQRSSENTMMGAWRTREAVGLSGAIDRLAIELVRAQHEVGTIGLRKLVSYGSTDRYWDIKRIAERLRDPATDFKGASNQAAIQEAAGDILEARRGALVSLWYQGSYSEGKVGGISIYWPDADDYRKQRDFYRATRFARDTHWDEFLDLRELGLAARAR